MDFEMRQSARNRYNMILHVSLWCRPYIVYHIGNTNSLYSYI